MKTEIPSQTLHSSVPSLAGYWIPKINQVHGDGIDATLRYARTVGEARRRLKFGEWTALCRSDEVAFGIRQGQNLVRIDKKLGDLDTQVSARLPWAWGTLYQLSLLPRAALLELVETKKINRRLTEAEAKRLVGQIRGERQLGKTSIKRRLKAVDEWIEENLAGWAGDERDQVTSAFAEFIKCIRSNCAGARVSPPVSSPAATCDGGRGLEFDGGSDSSDALDHSTLLRVGTPAVRSPDFATCDVGRGRDFESGSETSDTLDHSTLLRVGTPAVRSSPETKSL